MDPPPGGELLWLNQTYCRVKIAWGIPDDNKKKIQEPKKQDNGRPLIPQMEKEHGGGMRGRRNGS